MANIVLMGDSITEYFPYVMGCKIESKEDPIIPGYIGKENDKVYVFGVENIGIESYRRFCFPQVIKDNTDIFILLLGVNNIIRPDADGEIDNSIDVSIEKLESFINEILTENKTLIVQSLYPTCDNEINKKIILFNSKIKEFCEKNNIIFLDLYNDLCNEYGLLNDDYTYDGLHPNKSGYLYIIKRINNMLKKG